MARLSRPSRSERNVSEKNRRIHMKNLLGMLASLLPPQPSKLSIGEILNEATSHIHQLQRNRERLKRKKAVLKGVDQKSFDGPSKSYKTNKLLITNITTLDSLWEDNLVSPASNKNFMLHEIISVLQEEGAEVIDVAHINVGDKIIYIIKSQAISSRIGVETSRIEERLKKLVF